jgi:transposase-like protein
MVERNFPKTMPAFLARFGTEEACAEYLVRQKWPEGFRRQCGATSACLLSTLAVYQCHGCRHQHSITSGTAFHGTRKGLRVWFPALYLMVSSKQGLSAKELQRQLGLGSCQTAWTWLQKLRRCMVDPSRAPLSGEVEVDETYVGGVADGTRGRGAAKKAGVACAVGKAERGMGRVRLAVIEDCSKAKLTEFVAGRLELETTVRTDGWRGYNGLERSGYAHVREVVDAGRPPGRGDGRAQPGQEGRGEGVKRGGITGTPLRNVA